MLKSIIKMVAKMPDWCFWSEEKIRSEIIIHNPNFSVREVNKSLSDIMNLKIKEFNNFFKHNKDIDYPVYEIRDGPSGSTCMCGKEDLKISYILDFKGKTTTVYDYKGASHTGIRFILGCECIETFMF